MTHPLQSDLAARPKVHECPDCPTESWKHLPPPEGYRPSVSRAGWYKPCAPDDPEGYRWIADIPPEAFEAFIERHQTTAFMLEELRTLLPTGHPGRQ